MLTAEVFTMKKFLLLTMAIFCVLGANFKTVCLVEGAEGEFTPFALMEAEHTARVAAAEITRSGGSVTVPETRCVLRPRGMACTGTGLADAILLTAGEVCPADSVYVNGIYLGCVRDADELTAALRGRLALLLPAGVSQAVYTQELDTRRCYTNVGLCADAADMGELVASLCPVIFLDDAGAPIPG